MELHHLRKSTESVFYKPGAFNSSKVAAISLGILLFMASCQFAMCFSQHEEIFSSTTELQRIYRHESGIVKKLEQYAKALDESLQIVQKYIEDFKKIDVNVENVAEIVENPMNAYHILKRMVVDWEMVAETISNNTLVKVLAGEIIKNGKELPSFDDFVGGTMALVGLQDTYQLNLSKIIHGVLPTEENVQQSPYKLSGSINIIIVEYFINKMRENMTMVLVAAILLSELLVEKDSRVSPPTKPSPSSSCSLTIVC